MSFLSLYAIPVHVRRVVIIHSDDFKKVERDATRERETVSLMNLSGPAVKFKFKQHTSYISDYTSACDNTQEYCPGEC